ncbi:leucine-rich repeat protein [Perkinsela sp. CCAP 1560/4]|nr:leucine-rich repeat protein [Perkinsela sp. CCAP 1560/4]|eukprot:KNH09688.1 leucine-rich repeat protein [Perkinsela sp. CCAP 1560/4]
MLSRSALSRALSTGFAPKNLQAQAGKRSLFSAQIANYTDKNEDSYEICNRHGMRRIRKYLQQDSYGYWNCRSISICYSKDSGRPDYRNPDQATCGVHNRQRMISKLKFNPDSKLWECKPSSPCSELQ